METATGGVRVTEELADLVESAGVVAVTVTVFMLVMCAGEVERPVVGTGPTSGVGVHLKEG